MHRTACLTFTLCVLVSALTFAQPIVPQGGVVNAASSVPAGAPGYQLSPGSIVSIYGSNLSTSAVGVNATTFPLQTTLSGASVTIGGISAPIFYVSSSTGSYTQINAQIPYSVTPGPAVPVVVTTSAGSSAPSTIPVVATAPAIFTYSQTGLGNAAAQNYVSSSSTPANGFNSAIAQGGILIVYGTGGGALTTNPAPGAACGGASFAGTPVSATIGGQSASVQYAGCAPGYVGLDQWNIQVPSTIPAGCYLPLQVTVNGVSSNAVTISVASNGNCSSAATGQAQLGVGQAYGSLALTRLQIAIPGFNETASQVTGTFAKNTAPVAVSSQGGFPPANAGCYVQVYKQTSTGTPSAPTVTGTTPLDAGILTLATPSSGNVTLTPKPIGSYSASSLIPTGPSFPAITTGKYSLSGAGGANVGAFGPVSFTLPALMNVTNPGYTGTSISQGSNLNPTLTCPDPAGEIITWIIATNANGITGAAICTFSCGSNILVPSSVLKQLPLNTASATGGSAGTSLFYFFLSPNNNDLVSSATFSATGLDLGLFFYEDIYLVSGLSLTP